LILVDTSVWIGHLKKPDPRLGELLLNSGVLGHPFVTAEVALGGAPSEVVSLLGLLPQAKIATNEEVMRLIESDLRRTGVGLVDAHLLAAARLSKVRALWTLDRALQRVASSLGLGGGGAV
jgi:predicted nucleic acid-binding protein